MDNNLEIYEKLREVPKEAQKEFSNGSFKGTDINPMWRIKKMTEVFGMCGIGWYYEVVNREIVESDDVKSAFISINLYVKVGGDWSKPIYGEGGNCFRRTTSTGKTTISDEAFKMALTDAVSNATKQLGLGADIWFAQDVTKYTQQQGEKVDLSAVLKTALIAIDKCKTKKQLRDLWEKYQNLQDNREFKIKIISKGNEIGK